MKGEVCVWSGLQAPKNPQHTLLKSQNRCQLTPPRSQTGGKASSWRQMRTVSSLPLPKQRDSMTCWLQLHSEACCPLLQESGTAAPTPASVIGIATPAANLVQLSAAATAVLLGRTALHHARGNHTAAVVFTQSTIIAPPAPHPRPHERGLTVGSDQMSSRPNRWREGDAPIG